MYDDDDEDFEGEYLLEDGDHILVWTKDRSLEMGILVGVTDSGLLWKKTHRRVETSDDDWGFEELHKAVRVFSPWSSIDRVESEDDAIEEIELSEFSELMGAVEDPSDFEALVSAALDSEAE